MEQSLFTPPVLWPRNTRPESLRQYSDRFPELLNAAVARVTQALDAERDEELGGSSHEALQKLSRWLGYRIKGSTPIDANSSLLHLFDVALYFGETLRRRVSGTWYQSLGAPGSSDYGHFCIGKRRGPHARSVEPFGVIVVAARYIMDGSDCLRELVALFDTCLSEFSELDELSGKELPDVGASSQMELFQENDGGIERWTRTSTDGDVSALGASVSSAPGNNVWLVFVNAAEFLRQEPLESEFRTAIVAALSAVRDVANVTEEDRETWLVYGGSGRAILEGVSIAIDQMYPRVSAFMSAFLRDPIEL